MSFFMPAAMRRISNVGLPMCRPQYALRNCRAAFLLHARFESGSPRPPSRTPAASAGKPAAPSEWSLPESFLRKFGRLLGVDPHGKSFDISRSAAKRSYQRPGYNAHNSYKLDGQTAESHESKPLNNDKVSRPATIGDAKQEMGIQTHIVDKRKKVLWPGIWTLFALIGTYVALAYLDVKAGIPSSDGSHLPERTQLLQTRCLTPTVIREGIVAGWKELDSLTVGIFVSSVAIHLLRRSPLSIWKTLVNVTGKGKRTAFAHPVLHLSWIGLAANMTALIWFLPGVVHYFDGDLFHTSAFLISIPLITSYLMRFGYRFNLIRAPVLNMGASGAIVAAIGIYCVAYAKEKIWVPIGLVLRLDAREWGLAFALFQAYNLTRTPKSGNRHTYLLHLASFALGLTYAHFNLKHHLWIPLVSEISSTQESSVEVEK